MLLQHTTSLSSSLHQRTTLSLSSSRSYTLYFPLGHGNSIPIPVPAIKTPKIQYITCSISHVYSYGTVDYERKPVVKWNAIYKRISFMEDKGSATVLNQWEDEGRSFSKWDLCRVAKELRKFRKYARALEVYDWMNNRLERYRMTSSDIAIQLDLIAKVRGIESAEEYFHKVPKSLKDNRVYGALLNAYGGAKMIQNAESLFNEMREKGYANHALNFNCMMTLYLKLKHYEKIEPIVSEMQEKRVPLDIYSYNIRLSSCGYQGSLEKMKQVYEEMKLDPSINPNWTTYSTMATMYIRMDELEKAEECLKMIENRLTGRDRMPYHFLISLYGSIGNNEEIYRIWNLYKQGFSFVPNLGYYALISALIRCGNVQGAENMYEEWLTGKGSFDPRITNLLMSCYSNKGLSHKVEAIFQEMVEGGGKPNSISYEILAEGHIRGGRINEALSCLNEAVLAKEVMNWKPKAVNVSVILKVCEEENDAASIEMLWGLLKRLNCLDDEAYISCIMMYKSDNNEQMIGYDDGDKFMLGEIQGSL